MARIRKAPERLFRTFSVVSVVGGGLGNKPAPYLPIIEWDKDNEIGIVIKEGTILARDENGYIVPANGGVDVTLTYSVLDEEEGVVNKAGDPVTAGGTETLSANKPIGVAESDVYGYAWHTDSTYKFQEGINVIKEGLAMWALSDATGLLPGDFVKPGTDGKPVKMDLSTAIISGTPDTLDTALISMLEQKIGKIELIADANVDKTWLGGVDLLRTPAGLGLPGQETSGANNGLDPDTLLGLVVYFNFA